MRTDTTRIDVALGFDLTYAPHAAAVLASVVRSTPAAQFRFIILHEGVEAHLQSELEALAPTATFVWASAGSKIPEFLGHGHFSRATLFRLGLETLAPADCSRVIYLDTDIVVLGDLSELCQTDLQDNVLGAVSDENEDGKAFAARWMRPTGDYFNAGVLVIDLARVRAERLFSAATAFYAQHAPALSWADQDALNYVCAGRWQAIDSRWNVQRSTAIAETCHGRDAPTRPAPLIVHFTGHQKPWQPAAYHPWSWLYWQALAGTPFYDQVRRRGGVSWTALQRMRLRLLRRAPGTRRRLDLLAGDGRLDVSLVVATRNRARQLRTCLEAIARLEFDGTFEVIVVDNGSTDETAAVITSAAEPRPRPVETSSGQVSASASGELEIPDSLELAVVTGRRAASVRRVYHPRPGLGGARNAGLATAKGRIIAFTDDDCYVAPDFLTEVVLAFADSRIGCVSGRVELFDPSDAPITINRSLTPRRYPAGAGNYLHCDGIIGGNLAFRRTALRAIGGFDAIMGAGTPFAAEDVDAAARVLGEGWDGAYYPSMVVHHHHGRKAADIPKLFKSYDIGRGAYTVKYLLRGEFLAFAKGVAAVRWRLGPPWRWSRSSFKTPAWELYGALRYIHAHLISFARRKLGAGYVVD